MVLGTCLGSLVALVLYLQTVTKPGKTLACITGESIAPTCDD